VFLIAPGPGDRKVQPSAPSVTSNLLSGGLAITSSTSACSHGGQTTFSPLSAHLRSCLQCGLLANAGGVGGGPFYIPVFNVLLGFDLKASAALSITIVACGALASTLYGLRKTSPRDPNRTLLDFDLALTFLPALLLGVNFGTCFRLFF
jgi:uncharacterized membrane protein YfcA